MGWPWACIKPESNLSAIWWTEEQTEFISVAISQINVIANILCYWNVNNSAGILGGVFDQMCLWPYLVNNLTLDPCCCVYISVVGRGQNCWVSLITTYEELHCQMLWLMMDFRCLITIHYTFLGWYNTLFIIYFLY